MKRTLPFLAVLIALIYKFSLAGPVVTYVSQNAQTPFIGGANCNGKNTVSVATFNATSLVNGEIVWLCGTISSQIVPFNGGAGGNPIQLDFDTGASIQMPALPTSGGINLGGFSHFVIDGGGGSCGWINQQNSLCSGGQIESTANGTGQANQIASIGINANNSSDVEIKGLVIGPIYTHTSPSDTSQSPPGPECVSLQSASSILIHNDTMHDAAWCLTGTVATLTVNNNEFYNTDHGLGFGGANSAFNIKQNHFHDWINWDQGSTFHHDGIHLWASNGVTFNGATVAGNLFDGDQGTQVTAAIYNEQQSTTGTIENITDADNVVIVHSGRLSCCGWISFYTTASGGTATTGAAINNTIVGYYSAGTGACLDSVGWLLMTFENNAINGCQSQVTIDANSTISAVDYNDYDNLSSDQGCGAGCNTFSWHGSIFASFATWKTDCSCDSHGRNDTVAQMNFTGLGRPQSGSTVLGAGVNLTGLGAPITSDFLTLTWPSAGAWNMGAYSTQQPTSTGNGLTIFFPMMRKI